MITSNECWLKDTCKKYNDLTKECECRNNDVYCIKLFKLDNLYNNSLLTFEQRKRVNFVLDADGADRDVYTWLHTVIEKNIVQFVTAGGSLYLHSSTTGNGKTAWAIRMIQSYFNSIWYRCDMGCKALFINVPKFLLSIKDNISVKSDYVQFIKDNILQADLVVWDEVGTKGLTQFEHEHLLSLINARIDVGKCNIYTSNMPPNELKTLLGDRLYSRIVNLSSTPSGQRGGIKFVSQDKRGLVR